MTNLTTDNMKTKMQDIKPNTWKQEWENRKLWAFTMLVAGLLLALIY